MNHGAKWRCAFPVHAFPGPMRFLAFRGLAVNRLWPMSIARLQNVSEQEARQLYDWTHFTQRLSESDFRALEADMQFMLDNGMMRNRVDVRALVAPAALDGASAQ